MFIVFLVLLLFPFVTMTYISTQLACMHHLKQSFSFSFILYVSQVIINVLHSAGGCDVMIQRENSLRKNLTKAVVGRSTCLPS